MEQFRDYDDLVDCGSDCFLNRIDAEILLLTNVYLYRCFYLFSQTMTSFYQCRNCWKRFSIREFETLCFLKCSDEIITAA